MSTVKNIESTISRLSRNDLSELGDWFSGFDFLEEFLSVAQHDADKFLRLVSAQTLV